nr:hypothetical protein [Haloquadratum walsbyi]
MDSAEELVHVNNVLMDRELDSQYFLEMVSQCGLPYVVLKQMETSKQAQVKRLLQRGQDRTRLIGNSTSRKANSARQR